MLVVLRSIHSSLRLRSDTAYETACGSARTATSWDQSASPITTKRHSVHYLVVAIAFDICDVDARGAV